MHFKVVTCIFMICKYSFRDSHMSVTLLDSLFISYELTLTKSNGRDAILFIVGNAEGTSFIK